MRLEAFKSGRDSGIDLRYATTGESSTIVQCKHYAVSGYSKLLSHLRISELPKIRTLTPARYVVVTSVGLTPDNKDEIVAALSPFVLTPDDVWGANDIEGLLSRHPGVERANFKLWLTSTSVLERVMHNAELCQTEFSVERIRRKLPLFVQNEAFPRASELLEKNRVAVISGAPGIGKSTLADMLLYEHLERGFEPVVIRAEVSEGKKLFRPKEKQVFYYDEHFNPRLIEWLSSFTRMKEVAASEYRAHVFGLLGSPHRIWRHAFENQISLAARHVLLVLYSLGEWCDARDVELAFIPFHRHCSGKYRQPIAAGDFRKGLQELEGGFLSYNRGYVSFLNPSIREFIASVVAGDRDIVEDLLATAVRFKQAIALWRLAEARKDSELAALLGANLGLAVQAWSRLLSAPETRREKRADGAIVGTLIDVSHETKIGFLVDVAATTQSTELAALACEAAAELVHSWHNHIPQFAEVTKLLEVLAANTWFLTHGGQSAYDRLRDEMLEHLIFATAYDWTELLEAPNKIAGWTPANDKVLDAALLQYRKSGVYDERSECTTLDELAGLKESLEDLSKKYGLDFASSISSIDDAIAEREERSSSDDEWRRHSGTSARSNPDFTTDDDVAQMFDTLR